LIRPTSGQIAASRINASLEIGVSLSGVRKNLDVGLYGVEKGRVTFRRLLSPP